MARQPFFVSTRRKNQMKLNYFYGQEAEQFSFIRLPRLLITDSRYADLKLDAIVLYGLLLDRMGLSMKNNWHDEQNRVFIYYKQEDIQEHLRCGHEKAGKLLADLEKIGLIERIKQGQGRPDMIYVKNFIEPSEKVIHNEGSDFHKSEVTNCSDIGKQETQTSENQNSALPKNKDSRPLKSGSQDIPKSDTIYNDFNGFDFKDFKTNDIERQSITPARACEQTLPLSSDEAQREIDKIEGYRAIIHENIEYDIAIKRNPKWRVDNIVEIMLNAVTSPKDFLRVSQENKPQAIVKSVLLKLTIQHVEYVFESMDKTYSDIRNIQAYLLTALYKSFQTLDSHEEAQCNYQMYGED